MNCSTAYPRPSTEYPSRSGTVGSVGSVNKSLPGLPETTPAIRVDVEHNDINRLDINRLDPSVRDLADVLVKHLGGIEKRMEQRLFMLEQRQTNALEAIATHLRMNAKDKSNSVTEGVAYNV